MLLILAPLRKKLTRFLKVQEITTDNFAFRLHCIFTAFFLATASVLLTTDQLIGKPIECLPSDPHHKWQKPMETFCWITSTFIMPGDFGSPEIAKAISAYPGVLPEYDTDGRRKYYSFYQWACFALFLQAILCYLPKPLWELLEGGLQVKLTSGLNGFCAKEEKDKKTRDIIDYLLKYKHSHITYTFLYWGCEALCLLNVVIQMWMMDTFLNGQFWSSGSQVFQQLLVPQDERNDTLIYIFPRMTKCIFYHIGPSGGYNKLDNLCILPQNVINEKIYIILWFWYIALTVVFGIIFIYRVLIAFVPRARPRLLLLRFNTRSPYSVDAASMVASLSLGEWWMLYSLAKNIHPITFRELITDYAQHPNKKVNTLTPTSIPQLPLWPEKTELLTGQGA